MKKQFALALLAGSLTFAGAVNYSYDSAGRLVKVDYGSGGSITYTYDNAGNILTRTQVSSATVAAQAAKAKKKERPDKQISK